MRARGTSYRALSEHEQQRFGRELHGGLGQHLTAAAIQAELLARDLEAEAAAQAQRQAEHIEAMLSAAVAQTRLLARGLFPVELDGTGLMGALQLLAEEGGALLLSVANALVPRDRHEEGGIGLSLMRHRAQLIGATLQAGPGPQGWRVQVRWPRAAAMEEDHADHD